MAMEQIRRQRDELLALSEQLIAEYAGIIPAGSVMRTVERSARAHLELLVPTDRIA